MNSEPTAFAGVFRDDAVKMVVERSRPIEWVACALGVEVRTLRGWVDECRDERRSAEQSSMNNEQPGVIALREQNRRLRQRNQVLERMVSLFLNLPEHDEDGLRRVIDGEVEDDIEAPQIPLDYSEALSEHVAHIANPHDAKVGHEPR